MNKGYVKPILLDLCLLLLCRATSVSGNSVITDRYRLFTRQRTCQKTVSAKNAGTLLLKEVICIRFDQNLPQGNNWPTEHRIRDVFIITWIFFLLWRPPLWSSDQSSWLQIQRSWVRFPALPDFLRSSGSGTGFTLSTTEELLERKSSGSGSRKPRLTAVGILCADHATPSICKSWHKLRRQAAIARSV
jgi:hypothetical protein